MNKFLLKNYPSIIGFFLLPFILWFLILILNFFAPEDLNYPSVIEIISKFKESLFDSSVRNALAQTAVQVFKAISIALFFGTILGFILGFSRRTWTISQPTIDFFRSIPVTFLIPAFSLVFGSTSNKLIFVLATYPSLLIILVSIRYGITKQEPERILSFQIISGSGSKIKRFFRVTLFEILPDLSSGLRIALSYCIIVVTILEYLKLGSDKNVGIGGLIADEMGGNNYATVLALIILVGLLGYILNKGLEVLQNYFIHWSMNKEI